ncbi:hypothetical protein EDD22DRAFT_914323 [Suillus occidentalis]|nr:hypothetical protein EDD22DRAFT_914323 [Suillus occidentalis]
MLPVGLWRRARPSNALKDILLARTVSGESPSKVATKSPHRHRSRSVSPSKIKRNKTATRAQGSPIKGKGSRLKTDTKAPTGSFSGNAAAGPPTESGSKISTAQKKKKSGPTTRKGKGKAKATDGDDFSEAETTKVKPAPKRRGRPPKTKPQANDLGTSVITTFLHMQTNIHLDIDADPEPSNRMTRTSKAKPPDTSKVKAKLVEAPRSDDEGTLVEAPRLKTHSKRKPVIVTIESDDEDALMPDNRPTIAEPSAIPKSAHKRPSAKHAPLNRAQAKQRTENRQERSDEAEPTDASQTRKPSKWTKANPESPNSVKTKTYGSLTVDIPMKKSTTNPKRSAPDDDVREDVKQPLKKPKVSKFQSAKSLPLSNSVETSIPNAEDPVAKKPPSAMKQDTKRKKERPPESDDEDHMPKKPVSKKARFDEEPKSGVYISSGGQKENALPSKKPRIGKPSSKSKSRGPPKDVLDRIKASATLHRIDDSEPDPA